jgi:hypothetical protein
MASLSERIRKSCVAKRRAKLDFGFPSTSLHSNYPDSMAESPRIPQYSLDSPTAPELLEGYQPEHSTFQNSEPLQPDTYEGAVSPQLNQVQERLPTPPPAIPTPAPPPPVASTSSSNSTSRPPSAQPRSRNGPLVTPKRDLPVPDQIPGVLVNDTERHWQLRYHLADLCGIKGTAR